MVSWPMSHGTNHNSSICPFFQAGERNTGLWLRQRYLGVKHRQGITFPQVVRRESRKVKSEGLWDKESLINNPAAYLKILSVCRDPGKRWYKYVKQQKIDQGLKENERFLIKRQEAAPGASLWTKREAACFCRLLLI